MPEAASLSVMPAARACCHAPRALTDKTADVNFLRCIKAFS
jgi:hypothetical protein